MFFSFTVNLLWLYLPCRQTIVSVAVHRWLESAWMGSFKIPPACWLQSRASATQASAHSMDRPGGRKELSEQACPPCYPPQKPASLSKPKFEGNFLAIYSILTSSLLKCRRVGFCDMSHCVTLGHLSHRLAATPQSMGASPAQPPLPILWLHLGCLISHTPRCSLSLAFHDSYSWRRI